MEAELFDGTVLEFPDGTAPEVIQRVVKQQTAARQAAQPAVKNPLPPTPAPAAPEQPSTIGDMAKSLGSGVVRGTVELGMLPATIKQLGDQGAEYVVNKGDALVRSIFGLEPMSDEQRAAIDKAKNESWAGQMDSAIFGGRDAVRGVMDENLYAPKTTAGKYAETVGEFIAPGGIPSKAARAAPTLARKGLEYALDLGRNAVVPAVTSETAGQLTEGTKYEPAARLLGALAGNATTGLASALNTPESALRRAVGPADQIDWERALRLQDNSTGIRLTGPEAITQAQNGASALPNVLRMVEGNVEGRAATAPFFAARPAQVDTAVSNLLDAIGPQSPNPSTLGPRAAQAAEGAIAASPEGRALTDAIFNTGPRTTAQQAGEVIQPALRETFDRREGMRNALADQDYAAARAAAPTIPVDNLVPQNTVREPGYTRLAPGESPITGQPEMQPSAVPPQVETPALTSNTGPDLIQVDARSALRAIDGLRANERGAAATALDTARGLLFRNGGVDTSVVGLENARDSINGMITAARQAGDMHVVERLTRAREALDASLSTSPSFAQANRNFAAASEPLAPFNSPGMTKTVARDEFNNRFTTPPEQVPSQLATPSEAQNFNAVAAPEAREAMSNHLATQILSGVTDGAGNVSGERLAAALRDNEDMLRQFPEVGQRLQAVVDASANLPNARVGPIGEIAAAKDTAAASNAILPQNPLTGSQGETADAVQRLVQQDPETLVGLVRQNVADRYGKAATETQEANREFAGAKFHKDLAGNQQRRDTLEAVLANLPTRDAANAAPELLDVLQATGRRKPIGSATDFNASLRGDLGVASPAGRAISLIKSLGTSFVANAGDAANRLAFRRSIGSLADMFTAPNSVELIRDALGRSAGSGLAEALARTLAQTPAATRERN